MVSRNPVHFIKIADNFPYHFIDIKIAIALIRTSEHCPQDVPYIVYGVRGV